MFTRRHYRFIATSISKSLASTNDPVARQAIRRAAQNLGEAFKAGNPKHDVPKFIDACQPRS